MQREQTSVFWRRLGDVGLEHCEISSHPTTLRGHVLTRIGTAPLVVDYEVRCSEDGASHTATMRYRLGSQEESLSVQRCSYGWRLHGRPIAGAEGALDVDLSFTPATNTLAIRRLDLAVGESQDVTALWLRLPDFVFLPLRQRYTRIGVDAYRYDSLRSGFTTTVHVDTRGIVGAYDGGWLAV